MTVAELISENEALRNRVEELEKNRFSRDDAGNFSELMGKSEDIINRKRDKQELQNISESGNKPSTMLSDAIESLPGSFAIYDAEEKLVLCNTKTFEMYPDHASIIKLGVTYEEIIRTSVEKGVINVDPKERENYVRERLEEFRNKPTMFEQHRADGSWIAVYYQPNSDGGTVVTRIDITERKLLEEKLQSSERLLKTVIDTIPHWIMVKDRQSNYLMVNKAFADSYGRSPAEFENLSPHDLGLPKNEMEIFLEADRKVIDTGERVEHAELEITYPNGRKSIQHSIRLPLFDDSENIVGIVVDVEDITEYKLMEAQFRQVQKMKAVGTLVGGISRNFNNLLQIISGNIAILGLDVDSTHPHHGIILSLQESIKKGAILTDQLLEFSTGSENSLKTIDLNETIIRIGSLVLETHKDVQPTYNIEDDLWKFEGDQNQIDQVLLNILINSWQAMPEGGELILKSQNVSINDSFAKSNRVQSGRYIKLSITDTGEGMDQGTMDCIFQPFFTTKPVGQGTGLGLASAHEIIKNHQGIITVNSELGKWTTFDIYLPAIETSS